jgi:hypothetical protein
MKISDKTPAAAFSLQHPARRFQTLASRPNSPAAGPKESTYKLLIQSGERGRGVFEALIYLFLTSGPLLAIMQFAEYRAILPAGHLF